MPDFGSMLVATHGCPGADSRIQYRLAFNSSPSYVVSVSSLMLLLLSAFACGMLVIVLRLTIDVMFSACK